MSKEGGAREKIDISQYSKEINILDKMGILFDEVKNEEIIFNCLSNPYLPKPNDEARAIFGKLGNIWAYQGATKKLYISRSEKWEQPKL